MSNMSFEDRLQQQIVRYKLKEHERERMSLTAKKVSGCGHFVHQILFCNE